jgi:hypothetical protein
MNPERKKIYEQYKSLNDRIEAAKKAGNQDEVRRLAREMEEFRSKVRSTEAPSTARNAPGGDRAARMQHLRAAAENLKAAGAEAEAQHVMEMVSRMEAEGRSDNPRYRPEGRREAPQGEMTRRDNPSRDGGELRGQVEQMRQEIRELREELNRRKNAEK